MSRITTADTFDLHPVEVWLEPYLPGPDIEDIAGRDQMIYVLKGTVSVRIGDSWTRIGAGSFVVVPDGFSSEIQNESTIPVGFITCSLPNKVDHSHH